MVESVDAVGTRSAIKAIFGNPTLLVLSLAGIVDFISYGVVTPLLPIYMNSYGLPPYVIGLSYSLFALASVLLLLPMGVLSDVIGYRKMVVIGQLIGGTALFLLIYAREPISFLSLRFVSGVAYATFQPASYALLMNNVPPKNRGVMLGTFFTVTTSGSVLGPILGGFLASDIGFWAPFLLVSFTSLISAGLVGGLLRTPNRAERHERKIDVRSRIKTLLKIFGKPILVTLALVSLIGQFGTGLFEPLLPLYLTNSFSMSVLEVGTVWSGFFLLMLVSSIPSGLLVDKFGGKLFLIVAEYGWALVATGFVALSFFGLRATDSTAWWASVLLLSAGGALSAFGSTAFNVTLSRSGGQGELGTLYGTMSTFTNAGLLLGPLIGGILYTNAHPTLPFIVVACLWFLVGSLVIIFMKGQPKTTPA